MYGSVNANKESLIHRELDPKFDIEVIKKDSLFCTIQSRTENEIYSINPKGNSVELHLLKQRKEGVVNTIKTADGFYNLIHDENKGSRIEHATLINLINGLRSLKRIKMTISRILL